ncbi:MAG: hypothetical protein ACOZIN_17805 [Myxococcota bacterium]
MSVLAKMLGLVMMALIPGGIVVLCAYFLALAVREAYAAQQMSGGAKLSRAFASVRWKDVWHQARNAF